LRLRPFLLGDLPLDVGKKPGERHRVLLRPVRGDPQLQPFHPLSVRLFCRKLGPLIRLLISFYAPCTGHHLISMTVPGTALLRREECALGKEKRWFLRAQLHGPCSSWARFLLNMLSAMCRRRVLFCKITPLREFSFALTLTFRYFCRGGVV